MKDTGLKKFKNLSLACFIICILVWVPNLFFQSPSPLFMLTFVLGPIGIAFAAMVKSYWLIIANTIMFFSFFIFMGLGYFINSRL